MCSHEEDTELAFPWLCMGERVLQGKGRGCESTCDRDGV